MAGLKKPTKRDASKPGTVLVIFLVFFVLLSIGLGVWGYLGYSGQEKLRDTAKAKEKEASGAKLAEDYSLTVARDARLALGQPLDADELTAYVATIGDIVSDNAKYGFIEAKTRDTAKKVIAENRAALGYDDAGKKYLSNYKDKLNSLSEEAKKSQGQLALAKADLKGMQARYEKLQQDNKKAWEDAIASIDGGNAAALKAAKSNADEMAKLIERNQELANQLKEIADKGEEKSAKLELVVKKQSKELAKFLAEKGDVTAPVRLNGDVHALMLDISTNKTLWDHPLGKITRVDAEQGQVYINIGSKHGAKPELTFNVFAAGWKGQAERERKATVEVIRVIDANTSLCKVTSLFDIEGREIVLADSNKGRLQRESDNALKEGDLLFNMFWGSRVAIAGNVSLSGNPGETPKEQMRNLETFMQHLQNNGVKVDAYLDLTDNSIKGEINYRTRYLILGDRVLEAKGDAPKGKDKEKDKDKEGKDKEKEGKDKEGKDKEGEKAGEGKEKEGNETNPERAKTINEMMQQMRKDAVERGMFVISADNFLNVIGYRRPRSANDLEASPFRAFSIRAGQGYGQPGAAPEEKKGDEVK